VKDAPGPAVRLAAVLSHPTQYYSPWFRWVRAHTSVELRVFYLWDFGVVPRVDPNFGTPVAWDVDLLSGYESEFVPNRAAHPGAERFLGFDNPGLPRQMGAWRPDALLLFGYKWASHLRAVAWARWHRIPILFRGDSHLLGRGLPALPARLALRLLFSQFASFLYVGQANREYFAAFGVPPSRLVFAPHSVDASLFDRHHRAHRAAAGRLRADLGLEASARVVLFAGKLVAAKQPRELLEAFLGLRRAGAALVFVGDGPEKPALEERARGADVPVRFLPFANQSEMPARYLLADLFALPSRGLYETWGLAVNEAMHMGIPCLVSDRVGCQRDLVEPGVTGWCFEAEAPGALAKGLAQALDDTASAPRREGMRAAVERRIAGYTYARTTEGLLAALAALPARPRSRELP
jgi:glycosyltransferase involved in cell wall biosynthesis